MNGTSSTPSMCTQRPRSTHTSRTSAVLPAISNVFVVLFRTKPRVWVMTPSACSGRITFFRFLFFSKFSMPNTCNQGLRSRLIPSPQVKTVFLPSALCTLRFDGHPHLAMDVTASAVSARMSRFLQHAKNILLHSNGNSNPTVQQMGMPIEVEVQTGFVKRTGLHNLEEH